LPRRAGPSPAGLARWPLTSTPHHAVNHGLPPPLNRPPRNRRSHLGQGQSPACSQARLPWYPCAVEHDVQQGSDTSGNAAHTAWIGVSADGRHVDLVRNDFPSIDGVRVATSCIARTRCARHDRPPGQVITSAGRVDEFASLVSRASRPPIFTAHACWAMLLGERRGRGGQRGRASVLLAEWVWGPPPPPARHPSVHCLVCPVHTHVTPPCPCGDRRVYPLSARGRLARPGWFRDPVREGRDRQGGAAGGLRLP